MALELEFAANAEAIEALIDQVIQRQAHKKYE
jgi:hypothetical protein